MFCMGTASCQLASLGYTPNVACFPVSFPDSGNKTEWVSGNENLRVESCRLQASHMHTHSLARLRGVMRVTTARMHCQIEQISEDNGSYKSSTCFIVFSGDDPGDKWFLPSLKSAHKLLSGKRWQKLQLYCK